MFLASTVCAILAHWSGTNAKLHHFPVVYVSDVQFELGKGLGI